MTSANKRTAFFVLALLLLSWGCSDPTENPTPKPVLTEGTEGLVISFFENAPPDLLYPETESEMALLLENRGTFSIDCSQDNSEGCGNSLIFSRDPISITDQTSGFVAQSVADKGNVLRGRSAYTPGGKTTFDSKIKVEQTSVDKNVLIFAIACYPYETSFSKSVCVDVSPIRIAEDQKACNFESLNFESQGAPVAIKKIEQPKITTSGEVTPRFRIFLKNEGNGLVIERSSESFDKMCSNEPNDDHSVIGLISVKSATIGDKKLNCSQKFKLSGNFEKDFIECTAEPFEVDANSFVSTLSVVLSYGYQTTVSKKIKIEAND